MIYLYYDLLFLGEIMSDASKVKDRKAFDAWMKQFKHKRLLSVLDIEQIKGSIHYTVRRLAYWVKMQGKLIAAECLNFFKSNGLIGKGKVQLNKLNFCGIHQFLHHSPNPLFHKVKGVYLGE